MTHVRFVDVRFRRDGRDVLAVDSLEIPAGRRVAVLGPNGAGKTTLLRLIVGLDRPHQGSVLVDGEKANARRQYASFAFQQDVFLRRSLLDNLTLALEIRGVTGSRAREQALASLRLLGIEPLAERRADRISGGEARRASLARALALGSPLLLLDEPMAGLDGATYTRLLDELPGLIAQSNATALVVTHQPEEAFRLCDDLLILVGGRVCATGPKREVATNPRYRDVAHALGYTVLDVDAGTVAIPPDALRIASGPSDLSASVEGVSDLVYEWDVTANVQGIRVHVRLPRADVPPNAGDRIHLRAQAMYPVT